MDGPLAVGSRYKIKMSVMGRPFESENEIVALEPDKKFAIKTLAAPPSFPVTSTYALEPEGTARACISPWTPLSCPAPKAWSSHSSALGLDTALAALKKQLDA